MGDTEVDEFGGIVDEIDPQAFTIYEPDFSTPTRLVITNPDDATRTYRGFELVVTRRFADNWQLQASFVGSRSTGLVGTSFFGSSSTTNLFDTPNASINADGRLELDRPYVLKVLGFWRLPFDLTLSGIYRAQSGHAYTRTTTLGGYDADGDGVNDTLLGGGSVTINAEPRGARRLAPLHLVDAGLEKRFDLRQGRLSLRADVYNLLNVDTVLGRRSQSSSAGRFGDPLGFVGARGARVSAAFWF
jgi:hypothetical protein